VAHDIKATDAFMAQDDLLYAALPATILRSPSKASDRKSPNYEDT